MPDYRPYARAGLVVRVLRPLARIRRHPAHPLVPALAAVVPGESTSSTHTRWAAPQPARGLGRAGAVVTTDQGLDGDGSGRWRRRFALPLSVSA